MIERVARDEWARAVATIARATGDLQLAEDAVQDAFAAALARWPSEGTPRNPGAWITTVARNRALDVLRRRSTHDRAIAQIAHLESLTWNDDLDATDEIPDERLALIFTCCHPAIATDAQVALTLRLVAGLTTPEIAYAFLASNATMAQRLVRAQRKVRDAGIPIRTPEREEMASRLGAVLAVVYLVFNQGYSSPDRAELAGEALRLGELLGELLPDEPEVHGLRALMWLQHSRRDVRFDTTGHPVLLEDQDRSRWDPGAIAHGLEALALAARAGRSGPYQLQAAIAACHARAPAAGDTDWRAIVTLYGMLHEHLPTAVVALNRAAAVSLAEGADAALPLVDELEEELGGYHLFHATRADLLRRIGRRDDALLHYRRALELAPSSADRRFLARRIEQIEASPESS